MTLSGWSEHLSISDDKRLFSFVIQADYLKKDLERLLHNKRDDQRQSNIRLADEILSNQSLMTSKCRGDVNLSFDSAVKLV